MSDDPSKAQSCIQKFIQAQPYRNQGLKNEKKIIYQMFNQPHLTRKLKKPDIAQLGLDFESKNYKLDSIAQLVVKFDTTYGGVVKDYNEYLKESVFHYSLGEANYSMILEILKENYKRKFFKRTIAHIARFNAEVSEKNLNSILQICKEEKIPLTLLEIAYLFIGVGIINKNVNFKLIDCETLNFYY